MQASLSSSPSSSCSAGAGLASSLPRRTSSSSPSHLCARSGQGLLRSERGSSFCPSSLRSPSTSRTLVLPAVLCKVPQISQDSFPDEVLKSDSPVLVGFCAEWCGPCKLIGPVIDSVAQDFDGTLKAVKIDVDKSPELVKEYDVYGLPTIVVFKDGKEVPKSRKEGAINAKKLKALIEEVLLTIASP